MKRLTRASVESALVLCGAVGLVQAEGRAHADIKPLAADVGVDEHVGAVLPGTLALTDQHGQRHRLVEFFTRERPIVLTLAYYHCPGLCDVTLRELATAFRQLDWKLGGDYRALTISIDPHDTPLSASAKRENVLKLLHGASGEEWPFAVASPQTLEVLTRVLGYRYDYDAGTKQYAHPAVSIVLTPEGRVARYVYGPSFEGDDLSLALREARLGRGGATALIDRVVLSCFRYDASKHRYESLILGVMRGGAAAIALALSLAIWMFIRKGRARRAAQ